MKRRDLIKQLQANGYTKVRDRGNHTIYKAPDRRPVMVPRHGEINENTARTILRDAGIE